MEINLLEQKDIDRLVSLREGETKLGEEVLLGCEYLLDDLADCPAKFVVFGIPEDAGPRANKGMAGADTAWNAFLPKFINLQDNRFLQGENILLVGAFNFTKMEGYGSSNIEKLRKFVEQIDQAVAELVEKIVRAGKIPIVIGGGHNNAYGLLKGSSTALESPLNCINLDPHADYRELEGRHSGNGFSYAKSQGYLNKYFACCLHENYNSEEMLQRMDTDGAKYNYWESILRNELSFFEAIQHGLDFVKTEKFGVELDCDSIQDCPSSAQTPNGISTSEARSFIYQAAKHKNACYLHLPEAAPSLLTGSVGQVGKLLSYLVSDFIKAKNE